MIAWYWEVVLNELHIPTQVLHSDLSSEERFKVVNDFRTKPKDRDLSHLTVCILMYTINASGVNLDDDCWVCIVNTAAANASLEIQACARIIRVSQPKKVKVVRLCLENSHDEWRDAVQANKALFDAATKAYNADALEICGASLNTIGVVEEKEIMESKLGKICMEVIRRIAAGEMLGDDPLHRIVQEMASKTQIQKEPNRPSKGKAGKVVGVSIRTRKDVEGQVSPKNVQGDAEGAQEHTDLVDPNARGADPNDVAILTASGRPTGGRHGGADVHDDDKENKKGEDEADIEGSQAANDDEKDSDYELEAENYDSEEFDDGGIDPNALDFTNLAVSRPGPTKKYMADDVKIPEYYNTTDMTVWWRDYWTKHTSDTDKDSFQQNIIYTLYICMLDPHFKTDWTPADLERDSLALERALRMLNRHRFGIKNPSLRITPYINYASLNGKDGEDLINPYLERERDAQERADILTAFGVKIKKVQPTFILPELGPPQMEEPLYILPHSKLQSVHRLTAVSSFPYDPNEPSLDYSPFSHKSNAQIEIEMEARWRELASKQSEEAYWLDITKQTAVKPPWLHGGLSEAHSPFPQAEGGGMGSGAIDGEVDKDDGYAKVASMLMDFNRNN